MPKTTFAINLYYERNCFISVIFSMFRGLAGILIEYDTLNMHSSRLQIKPLNILKE